MKARFNKELNHIISDESAQGATEYILLLGVIVVIALAFKDKLQTMLESKVGDIASKISAF